jgi:simple sugar transport system ATP-binding protein
MSETVFSVGAIMPEAPDSALAVEAIGMTKRFGAFTALDNVSLKVGAGTVHALLGENGAGKSTLVKCVMGYYQPDGGQIIVGTREALFTNPRDAHAQGIGMVYQHFTLVPGMTVAENLMLARARRPLLIDWRSHLNELEQFLATMPFRVPLDRPVASLAAGEKQKSEILKQLFLKRRFLILDEPTSALTPQEADEMLGLLRDLAHKQELTILMITHKFREVMAFADEVTVLRRGKFAGTGKVTDLTPSDMAEMMIGARHMPDRAVRTAGVAGAPVLEVKDLTVFDDAGVEAVDKLSLAVRSGEILGIAGVSGNGQHQLIEALAGQRVPASGAMLVGGTPYRPVRIEMARNKVSCLPEEPLKNACVANMSVAENLAFRNFDRPPFAWGGWWLNKGAIVSAARALIDRYRVKTQSPASPIGTLSGGNVQRAVLARDLTDETAILIIANPCFGLDFAAVSEIRGRIVAARNRGAAVLLVSEDLDELFEISDRIAVMFEGAVVYQVPVEEADVQLIGRHMAGHDAAA